MSEFDLECMGPISPMWQIRPRQMSHDDPLVTHVRLLVKERFVMLGIHNPLTVDLIEGTEPVLERSRRVDHVKKNGLQLRPLAIVHQVHHVAAREPVTMLVEQAFDT